MFSSTTLPSARERLLTELSEELRELDAQGLRRTLTPIDSIRGATVTVDGRELVCWCANDYLGLSTHPALIEAAGGAAREWGVGARASRLLAGTTACHARLEAALAAWHGAEEAIVYASGYLANVGTLGALLSAGDLVLVDRLAHASLLDAARATRATFRVFRHNDPEHAKQLLSAHPAARRRIVVTEGVFSMDGDRAPLAELSGLAEAQGAIVYVDDAHGAFLLGPTGRGSPEAAGIPHRRFLYMGTLGKALGCQGGFVVGPSTLIDHLRNTARTFIYATALAVPVVAAATEALRVLEREPQRRAWLEERSQRLHRALTGLGASTAPAASHILPVIVGGTQRTVALSHALWNRGHWAPAIRPPTVPENTARLRLSVTTSHSAAQIDSLVDALRQSVVGSP